MKPRPLLTVLALGSLVFLPACKKPVKIISPAETVAQVDTPLLPVKAGDFWHYQVHLEIPPGVTQPGAAEVIKNFTRTRTYLGKASLRKGLPETDCFEVTTPGFPAEREFVDIYPDKILLRGSVTLPPETTQPLWYDRPIPFVTAGLKAGDALPEFNLGSEKKSRHIQVIGREEVNVPAGVFTAIRLLMSGRDGEVELRRTLWFSPGNGIIREEKVRYYREKLILRETQELTKISFAPRK